LPGSLDGGARLGRATVGISNRPERPLRPAWRERVGTVSNKTSSADRLRQIADEIRGLPEAMASIPGNIADVGGALVAEAIDLGAFDGPEHVRLRLLVRRARESYPDHWHGAAFSEAMTCLAPGVPWNAMWNASESVCELIAGAVVASQPNTGGAKRWSKRLNRASTAGLLILASLQRHHRYGTGDPNYSPLDVTELAAMALGAAERKGTVSKFFKKHFGDYERYVEACDFRSIIGDLQKIDVRSKRSP
jgi:hypothetical protein